MHIRIVLNFFINSSSTLVISENFLTFSNARRAELPSLVLLKPPNFGLST